MSKRKAKVIIEALNNYKPIHDYYPENLPELVPEYLETIPNSMMGWFDEPYDYIKHQDGIFRIYFSSYGGDNYVWYSTSSKWTLTD